MTPAIEAQWPLVVEGRAMRYQELADDVEAKLIRAGCPVQGLSHFALVVSDIHQTLSELALVGDRSWATRPVVWGEAFGCHAAMHHQEGVELEILQPTRASFLLDSLQQNGDALQHLCFNVEDIEQTVGTMSGEPMVDGKIHNGMHGRIAFFSPGNFCPLYLELCQPRATAAD